jgi:hypothetical protein
MQGVRRNKKMKSKILVGLLLAGSAAFAAPRVSFGIGFGAPAPVVAAVPPCPGPGYEFINGYWQYVGSPVVVHEGFRHDRDFRYDRDRGHVRFDRDRDRDHFRR